MRERDVESHFNRLVVKRGGLTFKWVCPGHVGVPDRIAIINGVVYFVEIKRVGGFATAMQAYVGKLLTAAGANYCCLTGIDEVDLFFDSL